MLTTQLSDWEVFCTVQDLTRQYYLERSSFPDFVCMVLDRRRRHGLEGDVHLLPDLKQQSRLENWMEYQNYHLALHERDETQVKDQKEQWMWARKLKLVAGQRRVNALEEKIKYDERKLEEHDKMLRWIEQQRQVMVAEQTASVTATDHERSKSMSISTFLPPSPNPQRVVKITYTGSNSKALANNAEPQKAVRFHESPKSMPISMVLPLSPNPPKMVKITYKGNNSKALANAKPPKTVRFQEPSKSMSIPTVLPFSPHPPRMVKITYQGRNSKLLANNAKVQKTGRSNDQKQVYKFLGVYVPTRKRSGHETKTPGRFRSG